MFISFNASAQIPINGFCKYQSFKIPPEYTSVQSVNFNKDAFNDLIIFNNSTKKYLSIEGTEEGFSNIRVYKIPFEISKFKSISTNNFREKYYAYVSRKNRSVGIISFNKYGKIEIDKLLKFNSYPENLDVADINNNGKSELLISGSAFEGLSIISQNWHGLDEKKILSKNSFNEAIFADLNNDGNPDVAAFNSVERSIYFFFNDGNGRLNLVRTIPLTDNITSLKSSDIDSDGFADIIFNKGNSIKVMWGDSVSSYNSTTEFETSNRSINFILSDYNLDGKVDIAYLNSDNSKISILFSKGNRKFHSEILYLKRESISDLINFSNKINNGIIALTDKGTLFYLSTLFSLNEETNILIGGTPVSLTHFDYKNDGILDIVFIDSTNNNLNFLIRGNSKQPVSFYSYPLFERHDKILVDDSDPYIKTFYTYSYNKKVVEILKINFKEFGVTRNSLYSPGKIISLKLNKDDFGNEKIYIAYLKNMALGLNINFVQDIRILSSDYP
ncbi:MAG TPA: VCBS repeat-containing protein, partial [Ignavibacteria bacterium]|nr:VCBS repeat-containing protein [Ignavibacteria bacterium]